MNHNVQCSMQKKILDIIISPPKIVRSAFPNFVWEKTNDEKKIYLTFDDGPSEALTLWILETLKKYNAKATFFCVGDNVRKYPQSYNNILKENHSVGNHTFNHLNGYKTKCSDYINNFAKANKTIDSNLFRPPYGRIKKSQAKEILKSKKIIMWNVLSLDYNNKISPQECFENIKKHTTYGSIIVFHDNKKAETNMKYALKKTLDYYSKQNYTFEKIR